ncbi:MAG: hypothetical protein DSY60_03535 [Persephonella sp.]|nr:MAG: hypothetical protein DSY60_03535 [Persephonella sp.]
MKMGANKSFYIFISYVIFIFSSLFYGKEIAKYIYKHIGYHNYKILISLISLIGLIIIFNLMKKEYTFLEFFTIGVLIFMTALTYYLTRFPTDRLHLLEYMILGILSYKVVHNENLNMKLKIFLAFLFVLTVGVLDEIFQSYLPNRDAEIEDIIRDAIGGFTGIIISFINSKK